MKKGRRLALFVLIIAGVSTFMILSPKDAQAQDQDPGPVVVGALLDTQNSPISNIEVTLVETIGDQPLTETLSQDDGRYSLPIPDRIPDHLILVIERTHFDDATYELSSDKIEQLRVGETLLLPDITLSRQISPAFWIAAVIFIVVLILIATGYLHNTLAALVGASLLFAVSYLDRILHWDIYVFDFYRSLEYIDWNVSFLIMGMMIVIAVIENTGIFQWLAFTAYHLRGPHVALVAHPDAHHGYRLSFPG